MGNYACSYVSVQTLCSSVQMQHGGGSWCTHEKHLQTPSLLLCSVFPTSVIVVSTYALCTLARSRAAHSPLHPYHNLAQVPTVLVSSQGKGSKLFSGACGCGLPSALGGRSSDKNSEQARLMTKSDNEELAMDSLHYFGVFDGHGGADAARHCAERMHVALEEALKVALAGGNSDAAPEDTAKVGGV